MVGHFDPHAEFQQVHDQEHIPGQTNSSLNNAALVHLKR